MHDLKGKVVLVTGGTSGIGRAAAVEFARHGGRVVVTGRRPEEGQETAQLIKDAGVEGLFIKADVSRGDDVQRMVRETVARFGRLDAAFNNAGVDESLIAMHEQTEAEYDRIFNINVKGLWLSMQQEIRQMLKQGGGAIVNNASVGGLVGFGGVAVYSASKHAVVGFTRAAALEYGTQGIRINAVAPAAIQTDMVDRFTAGKDEFRTQLESMHPIGRIGTPPEVAAAVAWLCSDASSFVTGAVVPIDGGFTAR